MVWILHRRSCTVSSIQVPHRRWGHQGHSRAFFRQRLKLGNVIARFSATSDVHYTLSFFSSFFPRRFWAAEKSLQRCEKKLVAIKSCRRVSAREKAREKAVSFFHIAVGFFQRLKSAAEKSSRKSSVCSGLNLRRPLYTARFARQKLQCIVASDAS